MSWIQSEETLRRQNAILLSDLGGGDFLIRNSLCAMGTRMCLP